MVVNKKEIQESIDVYLGDKQKEVLKTIDFQTLKMFIKANIELGTSYIVKGEPKILNQFKAYYLANSAKGKERLKHGTRMISEYANLLCSDESKEDIGVDDVLFIYAHKDNIDIGRTNEWLNQTILNDVVNRKLKGYVTIILSERPIDFLEKSGQLKVINFLTKVYKLNKAEAVNSVRVEGGTNNSSDRKPVI